MPTARHVLGLLLGFAPAVCAASPSAFDARRLLPPIRAELRAFSPYEPVLLEDANGRRLWLLLECGPRMHSIDQPEVPASVLVGDESCGGKPVHRLPVWGVEEGRLLRIALPAVEVAARERDSLWSAPQRGLNFSGDTLMVVGLRPDYGVYKTVVECIEFRLRRLAAAQRGHVWPQDDAHDLCEMARPLRRSGVIEDHAEQMWKVTLLGADHRELMVAIPFAPSEPLLQKLGSGWKVEFTSDRWFSLGGEGGALHCALLELCHGALASPPAEAPSDDKHALAAARRSIHERVKRVLKVMAED